MLAQLKNIIFYLSYSILLSFLYDQCPSYHKDLQEQQTPNPSAQSLPAVPPRSEHSWLQLNSGKLLTQHSDIMLSINVLRLTKCSRFRSLKL